MSTFTRGQALTLLTHADPSTVKALAESLIPHLGEISVLINRTGLIMLPYADSVEGTIFHLGEVLVSEAHVRIGTGAEGYALATGRDNVLSVAIALIDAALGAEIMLEQIDIFLQALLATQQAADAALLAQIETTRVEMETF